MASSSNIEDDLPSAPLTPPDCDLRDFKFLPLDVVRLRDSELASNETPEACWAAVLLWCASWHQVPAGSMPDDEMWIATQARYAIRGKIDKAWKGVRSGALRGWIKCSDGRLYHPVVAEKARDAWAGKHRQRHKTECARIKKYNQRHGKGIPFPTLEQFLSTDYSDPVARDVPIMSLGTTTICPEDVQPEMASKGEEQGQGQGKGCVDSAGGPGVAPSLNTSHPLGEAIWDQSPRAEQLAIMMRKTHGMKANSNDAEVLEMARFAVSDQEIAGAVELFRSLKPNETPNVGYIHKMIISARSKAARVAGGTPSGNGFAPALAATSWWNSTEGVNAKGAELGLTMRTDKNEFFRQYKVRVLKSAGPGPWRQAYLKEISREEAEHERVVAYFAKGEEVAA